MNTKALPSARNAVGDLAGLNFAILARLSDESRRRRHLKESGTDDQTARRAPRTGLDINNRDEQIAECTANIEARGGRVVYVYDEPQTSAYKRRRVVAEDGTVEYRVIRPVYRKALADLRRGVAPGGERLDGLICPDLDRLTRDNRDLEDSIDVVQRFGRLILDNSGALDLTTESGRTNARVITAFNNAQSAATARRVKRKHQALQREGIPTGGTRPFGWCEDKRTLNPPEARLLRKAVFDLFKGRGLYVICAEWNRAGIVTSRGKKWRAEGLRAMLRNPRMAGYRMFTVTGEDGAEAEGGSRHVLTLVDAEGNPVIGQWKRMITPERWTALLEIIGEASGRGAGTNSRKYMATGTLRCGKCDCAMRATKAPPSARKPEGFFWYTCQSTGEGGCGGVKVEGAKTDAALIELAIAKYELEAAKREATAAPVPWGRAGELQQVRENMAAAKAARKAGRLSAERYYADLHEYETEERVLLKDRNAHLKATAANAEIPASLGADWRAGRLSLTEQRAYLEQAFSAVIVHPAGRGSRVPITDRLEPVDAN
ncbi:recombinase family protein [Catenulispora pinisilvae]|uniref:recombinase family protein n=1 Tax=Catenulispora pinisilvae TaxID=2705253 RepID=UPI00189251EF|nr:recombinase family protein [Catenulispora pinisilvae]